MSVDGCSCVSRRYDKKQENMSEEGDRLKERERNRKTDISIHLSREIDIWNRPLSPSAVQSVPLLWMGPDSNKKHKEVFFFRRAKRESVTTIVTNENVISPQKSFKSLLCDLMISMTAAWSENRSRPDAHQRENRLFLFVTDPCLSSGLTAVWPIRWPAATCQSWPNRDLLTVLLWHFTSVMMVESGNRL